MRLTDIQGCEVRPGRLVEWTLGPATVAAASGLKEDSRPPAYIQESHLRTVRSVRDGGMFLPTWLAAVFDLPGRADLDVLHDALHTWTLRHETLRSGFRWDEGEIRRFTLDPGAVELRREVVGDFCDTEELTARLQHRFDTATYALGWPNFLYTAVVRDDSTSVLLAFDHSNVDGHSIMRIPGEIHALYAAGVAGRAEPEAQVSSYVDFCEIERADADRIDGGHEVVGRWREFIDRCGGRLPNLPVDLGLGAEGERPPQKLMREMLVDADAAAAFEAYCRPYGGTLVGLLAATSLIVQEIGGQPVYRTVVPFHTRVKSRWSHSVGWYVGGAPIEVPAAAGGLPGALTAVRDQLRANRTLARMPLARVLDLLGPDFRPASSDLYSGVSYLDARDVPGSERWVEWKAYGLGRVAYGDKVGVWVNRLHEGLWFASRYPDTPVAYKNMRLYVERLRDVILSTAT
ncbi:condensation domain-containing protein [Streptomyces sp. NPDC050560]|uniref:condensation domain-containing protein n=1 Tax=Streptomyces sp. NPDC050560 TaxID=3365630 RepID=UPI003792B4FD